MLNDDRFPFDNDDFYYFKLMNCVRVARTIQNIGKEIVDQAMVDTAQQSVGTTGCMRITIELACITTDNVCNIISKT